MKGLTSHVLDTLLGIPAVGVNVELWSCPNEQALELIKSIITNDEGRCLLADELEIGHYQIRFNIGDYFAKQVKDLPEPAFLNKVSVDFSIADSKRHYHIPLVASPWSYTTYKGGAPTHSGAV